MSKGASVNYLTLRRKALFHHPRFYFHKYFQNFFNHCFHFKVLHTLGTIHELELSGNDSNCDLSFVSCIVEMTM